MAATVLRVGGDENPRIDGVKRYGDEISTALGSVLFAEKEKRGGMCEPVLRLLGIPSLRRPPGRKEFREIQIKGSNEPFRAARSHTPSAGIGCR
jgi:hypothetical protein